MPPSERVRRTNPKEGRLMGRPESDRSIVLCGGSAERTGEGSDRAAWLAKETWAGYEIPERPMQTSLRGIANLHLCGGEQS